MIISKWVEVDWMSFEKQNKTKKQTKTKTKQNKTKQTNKQTSFNCVAITCKEKKWEILDWAPLLIVKKEKKKQINKQTKQKA